MLNGGKANYQPPRWEAAPLSRTQDYLREVSRIANEVDRSSIDKALGILYAAWKSDNQVFVIGNGGSASTATHFACDLNKWVSDKADRKFRAFSLVDNIPLVSALTNDNGWGDVYSEQLRNFFRKGDILVAISVHGGSGSDKAGPWSQNLLKAVKYARDNGGKVVGLSGFGGGMLKSVADACVVVPAASTPHVEGMHLVLTHLMSEQLRELVSTKRSPQSLLRESSRERVQRSAKLERSRARG
jgi:D-sedoheptulose 7-phosphate isomerase